MSQNISTHSDTNMYGVQINLYQSTFLDSSASLKNCTRTFFSRLYFYFNQRKENSFEEGNNCKHGEGLMVIKYSNMEVLVTFFPLDP